MLLLLIAALAVSGCTRTAPDDGKMHLTYWEKWERFEREAIQRVVDDFNRSQDRIVIHMSTFGGIDKKILTATAGGNPPDVTGLWAPYVTSFAERGAIIPLDDYMRRDGITRDHWIDVYADLCTARGKMYAVPTTPTTNALLWNKALFREAGLDPEHPPRTLAELDELSVKLTRYDEEGNLTQVGYLPTEPDWFIPGYGLWFGGTMIAGGQITANHPRNIEALEWLQGYSKRLSVDKLKRFSSGFGNFSSPQNAFFAGKVAMVFQGVWMHSYISQFAPGLDWGAAPWPKTPHGPENFTLADCDVLVIPAGVPQDRRDAAWEFVKFVSSQRGMETLCMGQRKNTPISEISQGFLDNHPHPYIKLFIDLSKGPGVSHYPTLAIWGRYDAEWRAAVEKMRYLQVDPATGELWTAKDSLDLVQNRIEAVWQRHQQSLALRAPRAEGTP